MEVIANASANAKPIGNIFRYKLSDDTMTLIAKFSKLHQYDDRHAYKNAWTLWLNENRDFVTREEMRLTQLGFIGDVIDKMFKAGRYYFREKKEGKKEVKEVKEVKEEVKDDEKKKEKVVKQTRNYIAMNYDFIKAVDMHLTKSIKTIDFKPQTSFIQFVEENKDILQVEVRRLYAIITNNSGGSVVGGSVVVVGSDRKLEIHKEIMTKLKKTFKNRYFVMSK
jgi:hypothetical protein